jgi:hypothetical protein
LRLETGDLSALWIFTRLVCLFVLL